MRKRRVFISIVWFKWWHFRVWHSKRFVQLSLGPLLIAFDFN